MNNYHNICVLIKSTFFIKYFSLLIQFYKLDLLNNTFYFFFFMTIFLFFSYLFIIKNIKYFIKDLIKKKRKNITI